MTEKRLSSRNSHSALQWWVGILFSIPVLLNAQNNPVATIPLKQPVVSAYVDRPGDLYVQFESGKITKYDINGKLLAEYTPKDDIVLFDPRDGARAFMYSSKGQWYSFAFFGSANKVKLKEEYAIEPVLACASGDQDVWLLDKADASLKKINTTRQTVDVEAVLPDQLKTVDLSGIKMREYQGFLFLQVPGSGLHIFSGMGRLLKSFDDTSISYFNFLGEELYFATANKLIFYDLFDGDTRQMENKDGTGILLMTDVRWYSILPSRVEVYLANP